MKHYVYKITNLVNGKMYIGKRSCKKDIEKDKYIGSGKLLKRAVKKNGIENFKKEILVVCNTEEEAFNEERRIIKELKATESEEYYNIAEGGNGFTSDEVKKRWENEEYRNKIRETTKKLWENPEFREKIKEVNSNRNPANKGLKLSEDVKYKIGIMSKQHWKKEEYRKKVTEGIRKSWENEERRKITRERMLGEKNHFYGRKHTEETKKKLSEFHKGNKYSLGKKHTEETKRKIGEKNRGRIQGEETRKKLSIASKKLWENDKHKEHMKTIITGSNNPTARKVICLNDKKIYDTITEASEKTGIYLTGICRCCKGQRETAGRINGEKAKWMYYEDYKLLINNEDR